MTTSDLTKYRDYADRIATGDHKPDCRGGTEPPPARLGMPRIARCPNEAPHAAHEFGDDFGRRWDCPGRCLGCLTDDERAQWAAQVAEIDTYLAATQEEPLW